MRVLFSPSESKTMLADGVKLDKECFCFKELFSFRQKAIKLYDELLSSGDEAAIKKLFGIKELSPEFLNPLSTGGCIKAIMRYDGVAYKALSYARLPKSAQEWIDENVMIFSNLFGPVLAGDRLPFYKLKQGEKLAGVALESFYIKHFSKAVDEWLFGQDVIDLRAGFYSKFYKLKQPCLTFKFIKDSKVISHYAKAYRGRVLGAVASARAQSIDEVMSLKIDGLKLKEIIKSGKNTQIILQICD